MTPQRACRAGCPASGSCPAMAAAHAPPGLPGSLPAGAGIVAARTPKKVGGRRSAALLRHRCRPCTCASGAWPCAAGSDWSRGCCQAEGSKDQYRTALTPSSASTVREASACWPGEQGSADRPACLHLVDLLLTSVYGCWLASAAAGWACPLPAGAADGGHRGLLHLQPRQYQDAGEWAGCLPEGGGVWTGRAPCFACCAMLCPSYACCACCAVVPHRPPCASMHVRA